MRKPPKCVYVALNETGDVLDLNTALGELKDDTSGRWHMILRYSTPKVAEERRRPIKRGGP